MQQKILDYIISYIQLHGYAPTIREIKEGVGLRSTSTTKGYLDDMFEQGILETDVKSSPRAIRVPGYKFVKGEQKCKRN